MTSVLRVLLIGHSEADADVVLQALRQGGYQPTGHRVDSRPALEEALVQPWELILCDWHVPGIGGAEALDILRTRRVDAPIIVVAGDLDEAEVLGAMKAGASDCIRTSALARLVPAVARELRQAEMRRAHLRAEAALRVSEERFAKAFDHAPIGMSMVAIDGTTLKVNRAMAEMFGYSEADLRNMPVWRFTHADDMPATIEQLQRLLEGDIDAWHLEKRFLHRDGSIVWGRSTTWLVRDAEGRALYVVSQVQDITEWRRLQEHMRRQQAELAHVLRVATMGETVAEIAHEVNQPLASIANFAHGVIARLDAGRVDVGAMRAVAEQIAGEALRASEVVRRLRDFLRKSEPNLVRCDANEVVRDALRLVEPDIGQHVIRLALGLTPNPLPVVVDRVQMAQVVLNLLRNAIDALAASPIGERDLRVETELRSDRQVSIRVCDTGIGLPHAAGPAIFDAFFTTKQDGLGLGLSISRSIVEAHGGEVWALGNSSRGATVGFTLPAAP